MTNYLIIWAVLVLQAELRPFGPFEGKGAPITVLLASAFVAGLLYSLLYCIVWIGSEL